MKETKSTSGNILVLTHWSYKDALIQTYTLPYVNIIRDKLSKRYKIILVTSEQENIALSPEELKNINGKWEKDNMELVALPYKRFGWKKMFLMLLQLWKLMRLIKREKIKIIHSFCMPAGGIAVLLSWFTGVSIIADSYEPHAEVMVENGTWGKNSFAFKSLFRMEKKLTKKAFQIIATTEAMKEYALTRYSIRLKEIFVKPACVNFKKFSPSEKDSQLLKKFQWQDKIICVYAGKLGGTYLKEEIFDFIKYCYEYWGDQFRFLMLTNASVEEINKQRERAGFPGHIVVSKFCFHDEVSKYLSLGDFAINPVRPGPTRRYCTSIKDGEYWAKGIPVVITKNISDDSEIIVRNEIGAVLEELDENNYKKAVCTIDSLLKGNRKELQAKIFAIAGKYRDYSIAENIYSTIYRES